MMSINSGSLGVFNKPFRSLWKFSNSEGIARPIYLINNLKSLSYLSIEYQKYCSLELFNQEDIKVLFP